MLKKIIILLSLAFLLNCNLFSQKLPDSLYLKFINMTISEFCKETNFQVNHNTDSILFGINTRLFGPTSIESTIIDFKESIDRSALIKTINNLKVFYFFSEDSLNKIMNNKKWNNKNMPFYDIEFETKSRDTIDILIYDFTFSGIPNQYNYPKIFGCSIIPNGRLIYHKKSNSWEYIFRKNITLDIENVEENK